MGEVEVFGEGKRDRIKRIWSRIVGKIMEKNVEKGEPE